MLAMSTPSTSSSVSYYGACLMRSTFYFKGGVLGFSTEMIVP